MDDEIKKLDEQIIALLSRRFSLFLEKVGESGDARYSPVFSDDVLRTIAGCNRGPIPDAALLAAYSGLITSSLGTIAPLRVAYLGPPGTFTHSAMIEMFGETVDSSPMKTIPDVFAEVEAGRASHGVVPIENSTEGAVTYTLDELIDTDLKVIAEKSLRIKYCLVSVAGDMKSIRKLYSHPQSFGQCKEWIRKNLPDAEMHTVNSTSLAAETASWDSRSAAIASEASASLYKLNILAASIEDSSQNYTRFFVLGRNENLPTGRDKTSIICAVKDKPGALYELLRPLGEAGINMTRIESRPDKKKKWEYVFFIDFMGHEDSTVVKSVIEKMKEGVLFLKILGSYPAGF